MAEALHSLLAEPVDAADSDRRADLVLESAWLPVMWMPLTAPLLAESTLHALARHRLALLWGEPDDPGPAWDLRVLYRPGDASATVYALAPGRRASLVEAAKRAGWQWASLQPAFEWAWQLQRKTADGWWVCVEQDRALVARRRQGQWQAFDASASLPEPGTDALAHWQACARHESHRRGLVFDASEPLVAEAGP